MSGTILLLNLPRDLGDCLFCTPAIQALLDHAKAQDLTLTAIGSKRSSNWVETLGGVKLNWVDVANQPLSAQTVADTRFVVNFDFYEHTVGDRYPSLPLYQPEKLDVRTVDNPDFGAGAVVGKKHVFHLLEDCLKDAGVLSPQDRLPLPALPADMLDDKAVAAAQAKFSVSGKYALLVPVCAANRPFKRWQPEKFVAVAQHLMKNGITPLLLGGPSEDEKKLCADIATAAGGSTRSICGQTDLGDIAALARDAVYTLGNDTGPTHIAAASGAPVFTLYGYYNDPATWQSLTPRNTAYVLHGPTIQDIAVDNVLQAIGATLTKPQGPVIDLRGPKA